ncbi:MAG TPA: glycosyltransferase family 4 protein [Dehalococcoidia bacterium]|nr:glycosyltransferase family 4 protein [Dehalococcoidia bacterium]
MKIALVSPYDFAHPGGVASHISSLEQQFTRMGHDVKIIAPASRVIKDFGDRFISIGRPYPIPSSDSVIRVPISLHLAPIIKETLAREQFDIIHLHEPFMPMLCSAIVRLSNNTVNVGTFHAAEGKPGYNWGRPVSTWMIRRRLHNLHGRIAVSKPAQDYHSKYIPGPYEIIPNGIDLEPFSDKVAPFEEYRDGKKNILFVGRLEFRKGLNYLLNAFLLVKREIPDVRLIVVGPGTRLRRRYERWVQKTGLEKDVIFAGYVSNEDKARYYKTADIFCAPATSRESFGIVLLEAMATGKPVVATNIPGYASVVSDGEDGILVPPQNYNELSRALKTLLNDENLCEQMGMKGKAKSRNFSWELVAQQVMDYYLRIIGEVRGKNAADSMT